MKRFFTSILVTSIMIIGILGITNPGFRQPYKLFGNVEGKVTHNYFIFSVYQQYYGYTSTTDSGKYTIYKRYIAIALNFYEISPLQEERE
jgi:hypothetical protein